MDIALGDRVTYVSKYSKLLREGVIVRTRERDGKMLAQVRVKDRQGRITNVWMNPDNLTPEVQP